MPETSPGVPSPQFNIIYIMRRYGQGNPGGIRQEEKVSKGPDALRKERKYYAETKRMLDMEKHRRYIEGANK